MVCCSPEKQEKQARKESDETGNNQCSLAARIIDESCWVAKKIGDVLFHNTDSTFHISRVPRRVDTSKSGMALVGVQKIFPVENL